MIATNFEMREVRRNPKQVLIILVYKDTLLLANDLTSVPSIITCILHEYDDVFLEETPAGLPCVALNIKLISSLELHFQTIRLTAPTLKKPRRFKGNYKHF